MLVLSVHYTFAADDADTVESIFRELRDASRLEEGVIRFEIARSREHPNVFVLWEEYRDQAAVDAHSASEHFKRLVLNRIRPLAQQRVAEFALPI